MATRKLLAGDDRVIGSITWDGKELTADGGAVHVFAALRKLVGDDRLGPDLMEHGWSNGYVWLGESSAE